MGRAVNFDCGCFVSFSLLVAKGKLRRIEYSTNGCGFMIAAARVLADDHVEQELVELGGGSVAALSSAIADYIGEFPIERQNCTLLAVVAFQNALKDHRKRTVSEFQGDSPLVCTCFGVTEETITSVIATKAAVEVSDVTRICRAGGGCGSCTLLIQEYLDMRASAELY